MDRLNRAVFMMEEDASIPIDGKTADAGSRTGPPYSGADYGTVHG